MRTAAVLYATGFRVSAVAAASSSALSKNLMRGYVTTSGIVRAKIVEVVPALGESITEGSIAKWSKNVGDRVNVDDVVVIVETDKVTVDIKSTNAGVLTAQLATDTVTVGHPLFELDTDGVATATSAPAAAPAAALAAAPVGAPAAPQPTVAVTSSHGRTPLIKFLGKRSLLNKGTASSSSGAGKDSGSERPLVMPTPTAKVIKQGNGVDFATLKGGAWYGRPRLSDAEIRAIESGGADV